jgi:aspartyl/asparaginyl beta-hydroxylase (cupin superfamily)
MTAKSEPKAWDGSDRRHAPRRVGYVLQAVLVAIISLVLGFYAACMDGRALAVYNAINGLLPERVSISVNKFEYFPNHVILEQNWHVIVGELQAVLKKHDYVGIPESKDIDPSQTGLSRQGAWRSFVLIAMRRELSSHSSECPQTIALLRRVGRADGSRRGSVIRNAYFSILMPNTTLPIHANHMRMIVRYHLALVVPEPSKAYLVHGNGSKAYWSEGRGFLWDDNIYHTAVNRGNQPRIVLLLDVERCDSPWYVRILDEIGMFIFQRNALYRKAVTIADTSIQSHKRMPFDQREAELSFYYRKT